VLQIGVIDRNLSLRVDPDEMGGQGESVALDGLRPEGGGLNAIPSSRSKDLDQWVQFNSQLEESTDHRGMNARWCLWERREIKTEKKELLVWRQARSAGREKDEQMGQPKGQGTILVI